MRNNRIIKAAPTPGLFIPHKFETSLKVIGKNITPKIYLTPEVYIDTFIIAKNSGEEETGWLGTVKELGNNRYLIDKLFLPKQAVHKTTCELSEEGLGELFTKLAEEDFESCERMHFWGHVHPTKSTDPSGQDNDQIQEFGKFNSWFIRGIFNFNMKAEFDFFDFEKKLYWKDVPWAVQHKISREKEREWLRIINKNVTKLPPPIYDYDLENYGGIYSLKEWQREMGLIK